MKHKKEKIAKTNALRQLDKQKIPYIIHTYEWSEDKSGGLGVAEKLPELADRVFKTIVLKGKSKNLYVCVIHGEAHLDLRRGLQMEVETEKLVEVVKGNVVDLTMEEI